MAPRHWLYFDSPVNQEMPCCPSWLACRWYKTQSAMRAFFCLLWDLLYPLGLRLECGVFGSGCFIGNIVQEVSGYLEDELGNRFIIFELLEMPHFSWTPTSWPFIVGGRTNTRHSCAGSRVVVEKLRRTSATGRTCGLGQQKMGSSAQAVEKKNDSCWMLHTWLAYKTNWEMALSFSNI
jgi:hypothetical protein